MNAVCLIALVLSSQNPDQDGLSTADLPRYREALTRTVPDEAEKVSFHDLWNRPGHFSGRFVRVQGRVVRLFQTGAVGELPPRGEAWLATPAGDLFCVVCPATRDLDQSKGQIVAFEGTFLGTIRYQAGDVARLAPLVVGKGGLRPVAKEKPASQPAPPPGMDWLIGLGAAGMAIVAIVRVQTRRPPPRREVVPDVEFSDSPSPAEDISETEAER